MPCLLLLEIRWEQIRSEHHPSGNQRQPLVLGHYGNAEFLGFGELGPRVFFDTDPATLAPSRSA
jgi:hypothetical protein